MSNFQEEFNKRLRRVCGVTDDSRLVTYETRTELNTVEHTMGQYTTANSSITVYVWLDDGYHIEAFHEFNDLGELMRAIEEVDIS